MTQILIKFPGGEHKYFTRPGTPRVKFAHSIPARLMYAAEEIYRETEDGSYACLKHRSGNLHALTPNEVTLWLLKASPVDITQYTVNW